PLLKAPTTSQQEQLDQLAAELVPLESARQARVVLAEHTREKWEPQVAKAHKATTRPAPATQALLVHLSMDKQSADMNRAGFQLDGARAINLGNDTANFNRTDKFSFGAWIKPASPDAGAIVARMNDAKADRGYDLLIHNGKLEAHLISSWPADAM